MTSLALSNWALLFIFYLFIYLFIYCLTETTTKCSGSVQNKRNILFQKLRGENVNAIN